MLTFFLKMVSCSLILYILIVRAVYVIFKTLNRFNFMFWIFHSCWACSPNKTWPKIQCLVSVFRKQAIKLSKMLGHLKYYTRHNVLQTDQFPPPRHTMWLYCCSTEIPKVIQRKTLTTFYRYYVKHFEWKTHTHRRSRIIIIINLFTAKKKK